MELAYSSLNSGRIDAPTKAKMKPQVSVAMATYNGERFLKEQLESLARQTLLPLELVACDDGSTDATLDILRRFEVVAPFLVRVYQNENRLGHGRNFLRAASLCSGELIAFSDQDDVWLEEKLERCSAAILDTESNLVVHSGRVVDSNLRPVGFSTPSARRETCIDSYGRRGWRPLGSMLRMCPGFACVFRAGLLRQMPPSPPLSAPERGHEYWLFFAAEAIGRIVLIPDVLALYRQHERNTCGFRPGGLREYAPAARVGHAEYADQAETELLFAKLLSGAAERLPELRLRLQRAQRWHEERAESLAFRASLYAATPSLARTAGRLLSLLVGGTYRPTSQGGIGIRGLAKDLVVPFLARTAIREQANSKRAVIVSD